MMSLVYVILKDAGGDFDLAECRIEEGIDVVEEYSWRNNSSHCNDAELRNERWFSRELSSQHWIPSFNEVPSDVLIAGNELDGSPIYVGRSHHKGDLLPVKVLPSKNIAYASYADRSIPKHRYEVLCGTGFMWIPQSHGEIPPHAVSSGSTAYGESLYIGRAYYEGSLTPGKIHPSHRCMFIAHKGKEIRILNYEILVNAKSYVTSQNKHSLSLRSVDTYDWEEATNYKGNAHHAGESIPTCSQVDGLKQEYEFKWTHSCALFTEMPSDAIVAGHEFDGIPIYVGRAQHEGDLLAVKVVPSKNIAYASYADIVIPKHQCEILCGTGFTWVPESHGNIPSHAVSSGCTANGESLYIGRAYYEGSLTVGKIHPSHRCMFITHEENEIRIPYYEVLVYAEGCVKCKYPHAVCEHGSEEATNKLDKVHNANELISTCGRTDGSKQDHELKWTFYSTIFSVMPSDAVVAGYEFDGSLIYIGRMDHEGDVLPIKIVPSKNTAYATYADKAILKHHFEVLCGTGFTWVPESHGNIPSHAVSPGCTANGESLYIGRAYYEESLTVGKIHPSHRCMFIAHEENEIRILNYEVLVYVENCVKCKSHSLSPQAVGRLDSEVTTNYEGQVNHAGELIPTSGHVGLKEKYEYKWMHSSFFTDLPSNAVFAGKEFDGTPIYVGRAHHKGDNLPAKVTNGNIAYVAYDGRAIPRRRYEVLCGTGFTWVPGSHGKTPRHAVSSGCTANGEPLYIGRVYCKGVLMPGKIHPSHRCMYIAIEGYEFGIVNYEVHVYPESCVKSKIQHSLSFIYSLLTPCVGGHDSDEASHCVNKANKSTPSLVFPNVPFGGENFSGSTYDYEHNPKQENATSRLNYDKRLELYVLDIIQTLDTFKLTIKE